MKTDFLQERITNSEDRFFTGKYLKKKVKTDFFIGKNNDDTAPKEHPDWSLYCLRKLCLQQIKGQITVFSS